MTYHYTMCGLDYVYLTNGYTEHVTDYGPGISIESADSLDRAIAVQILFAPVRLRGQDVRFLRSLTDGSQTQFATLLGLKRLSVVRWEASKDRPIPGPADRVLRAWVASRMIGPRATEAIIGLWSEIADGPREPLYMRYQARPDTDEPSLFPEEDDAVEGWGVRLAA